jgi:hypothetical protein
MRNEVRAYLEKQAGSYDVATICKVEQRLTPPTPAEREAYSETTLFTDGELYDARQELAAN